MKLWIFHPGLFSMILTLFNVILACDSFQNGRYKKIYIGQICAVDVVLSGEKANRKEKLAQ